MAPKWGHSHHRLAGPLQGLDGVSEMEMNGVDIPHHCPKNVS